MIEFNEQTIGFIFAAMVAFWNWWQNRQTSAELQQTQDFFDPESIVVTPTKRTPARGYYMSEDVKQFILQDAAPDEKGDIYKQIQDAEAHMDETGKAAPYVIKFRSGRWYIISFGQIAGGGSPGAPIPK
jgi:hypothetical protein